MFHCVLTEVTVEYHQFCDQSADYWDVPRLGGVASYLYKTHESQLCTSSVVCCLYNVHVTLPSFLLLHFISVTEVLFTVLEFYIS